MEHSYQDRHNDDDAIAVSQVAAERSCMKMLSTVQVLPL
jgi:hypothetical protein